MFLVVAFAVGFASNEPARALTLPQRKTNVEPGCEILEYGPYTSSSVRRHYDDPSTATGRSFEIDNVEFPKLTTAITMKLGTGFGIRYRARVSPRAKVSWRVVYPRALRGVAEWRKDAPSKGDHVMHFVHDFEYDWELAAGRWEFQVLVDGKMSCGIAFSVK